jgi:hypothetical protein
MRSVTAATHRHLRTKGKTRKKMCEE